MTSAKRGRFDLQLIREFKAPPELVNVDLAPPLASRGAKATDPAELQK